LAGKLSFSTAQLFGKKGTALPGKVALTLKPDLLEEQAKKCDKIVFVTGTNGKTTTNNLSTHIFKGAFNDVISNLNGSNMIQGVLTPFITDSKDHYDIGIFEVDEGSVPVVSEFMKPDYFIITNFFRDQLDRYGEVENTIKLVHDAITPNTTLIINTDEPSLLRFDDLPNKKVFYGLNKTQFAKDDISVAESIFCPNCGNRFTYDYVNYGNVGKFSCENCGTKNHEADYFLESVDFEDGSYKFTVRHDGNNEDFVLNLRGLYNLYNTLVVFLELHRTPQKKNF
jgi:UDP-N-acetylmuramyl tripeptide synthase